MGSHHSRWRQGLTTSIGIIRGKQGIIIDNGSGIINVVPWIKSHNIEEVLIFQTHLHVDYVCGLPQNQLLFQKDIPVTRIYSPVTANTSVKVVYSQVFNKINWPVRPEDQGIYHNLQDIYQLYFVDGIQAFPLSHPGGCVGYRTEYDGDVVVIATDHEPGQDDNIDRRYVEMTDGASIVVADLQYSSTEYSGEVAIGDGQPMSRKGWGHGTLELLASVLHKCNRRPGVVLATHHDPNRSDLALDRFGKNLEINMNLNVQMTYDRMIKNIL